MATRNVDVGAAPADIVSSLSLSVGEKYTVQNVDAISRIFLRRAAVRPTGGALRGFVLAPGGSAVITPESAIGVWLWTDRPIAKAVVDTIA